MIVGSFKVKHLMGEGAFGRVFYGEHALLGAKVPVCIKEEKTRQEPYMSMFREEAILLAKIRHFGLPVLLDYVEKTDQHGQLMVLSFIPGTPLDKDVQENGPIDDEHLFWILDRFLAPLGYLHGRWQMVHCDLKPANAILHIPEHEVVLVDLGMAVQQGTKAQPAKGGTPGYIPPEFEEGYPPLPESDIYSVGKVAIFLATGDPAMVQRGECPSDMDPDLQILLREMTRRDPMQRPGDADLLRDRLADLREGIYGKITCDAAMKRRAT